MRTSENALRKEVNLLQKESRKLSDVIRDLDAQVDRSVNNTPAFELTIFKLPDWTRWKRTRMQNHRTWNDDEQAR